MRVLIVNDYATAVGGAEIAAHRLRAGLRRRGHQARLFASRAGSLDGAGAAVAADHLTFGTTSSARGLVQSANPLAARDLARVLRAFEPDVVHVKLYLTQLSPLILPVLRGVPAVQEIVWYREICPRGTKVLASGDPCHWRPGVVCLREGCVPRHDWPALMAQRRLARRWRGSFDTVVTNSETMRARLGANGLRVDHVLPYGVPAAPASTPGPVPLATYAGRLETVKGVDVLLEAFALARERAPAARLLIAGDGPEAGSLRVRAEALGVGDGVELAGAIAAAEVDGRLAGAWAHVVPSRWAEPFGRSCAEAMARGVAVVASRAGGLSEQVVEGVTGHLVAPGEPADLGRALARLLADREHAVALGAAGRERALATMSEDAGIDGLLDIYAEAIARART